MDVLAVISALEPVFRALGPANWDNPRPMSTCDDPLCDQLGRWVICIFSAAIPVKAFSSGKRIPSLETLSKRVRAALSPFDGIRVMAISLSSYPARPGLDESVGFRICVDMSPAEGR